MACFQRCWEVPGGSRETLTWKVLEGLRGAWEALGSLKNQLWEVSGRLWVALETSGWAGLGGAGRPREALEGSRRHWKPLGGHARQRRLWESSETEGRSHLCLPWPSESGPTAFYDGPWRWEHGPLVCYSEQVLRGGGIMSFSRVTLALGERIHRMTCSAKHVSLGFKD